MSKAHRMAEIMGKAECPRCAGDGFNGATIGCRRLEKLFIGSQRQRWAKYFHRDDLLPQLPGGQQTVNTAGR